MVKLGLKLMLVFSIVTKAEKCLQTDYSSYILRGYQSSYLDVNGRREFPEITGCEPIQLWSMVRHGTRRPNIASLTRMDKYLMRMRKEILSSFYEDKSKLCEEVIARFEAWNFDRSLLKQPKFLTPSGYDELVTVGSNMKHRFPTLLGDSYDPKRYYFAYSNNQRNVLSCDAFGRGIFGDSFNASLDGSYDYLPEVGCRSTVAVRSETNPKSVPEVKKFYESAHIYERVSKNYAFMTGIPGKLSEAQIDTIFEACQYETANRRTASPWCSVLDPYDLSLWVYSELLLHYYDFAYGNEYSKEFGCRQIKGLVDTFNKTINNGYVTRTAKVYITHDLVMEMFFTGMGCFKDPEPVTADYSKMTKIKYNNSLQTPFAATIAAVLYRCKKENTFKVQFYLNERPMGCCISNDNEPCLWNDIVRKFRSFLSTCQDDICEDGSNETLDASGVRSIWTPTIHPIILIVICHILSQH